MTSIFFYGLFMDVDLLRAKGLTPRKPRLARVNGYQLEIRERAGLAPSPNTLVDGVVIDLEDEEIAALYGEPAVAMYGRESVRCDVADEGTIEVAVYNTTFAPDSPVNTTYLEQWLNVARKVGLPIGTVEQVLRAADGHATALRAGADDPKDPQQL